MTLTRFATRSDQEATVHRESLTPVALAIAADPPAGPEEQTSRPIVPRTLGHQPAFDGLRAIAVVSVLGRHLGFCPGGNNGVTLFFVLSGFLITALLLQEYDAFGRIDVLNFYARRGLRLLPALVVVLVLDVGYVALTQHGYYLKADFASAAATLFYFSNWCLAYSLLPLRQLGHTWSLAVEEQFYLVWPFLLVALLRFHIRRRRLAGWLLFAAAVFAAERFGLQALGRPETRLYAGLDTRADALLFGCAGAIIFRHRLLDGVRGGFRVLGWAGLASLVLLCGHLFLGWGAVERSRDVASLVSYTAAAALSGISILALAQGADPMMAVLPLLILRPMQYVGRISYGLYLWHYLLFTIADQLQLLTHGLGASMARTAIALLVAILSYELVERPFLRLKRRYAVA